MKYRLLTDPTTIIKEGDGYIRTDRLVNEEKPEWSKETNRYSFGKRIDYYPEYSFRRPIVEPVIFQLNADRMALITPDGVKVGCSSFSHEVVLELAEKVKEIRKKS